MWRLHCGAAVAWYDRLPALITAPGGFKAHVTRRYHLQWIRCKKKNTSKTEQRHDWRIVDLLNGFRFPVPCSRGLWKSQLCPKIVYRSVRCHGITSDVMVYRASSRWLASSSRRGEFCAKRWFAVGPATSFEHSVEFCAKRWFSVGPATSFERRVEFSGRWVVAVPVSNDGYFYDPPYQKKKNIWLKLKTTDWPVSGVRWSCPGASTRGCPTAVLSRRSATHPSWRRRWASPPSRRPASCHWPSTTGRKPRPPAAYPRTTCGENSPCPNTRYSPADWSTVRCGPCFRPPTALTHR